ncbi:DUF3775 domain-containing protein [Bacillus velezensis]|uniref:DUF3775 domain-containing protein n=1 Tax=Bacillus velezensis TaxID=492670 RepID=UPI0018C5895B|nr:DUF3775 domain-containing protein [Bacillus velezensis]QPK89801.1 DUF3775 domain-containing protein [Bacillus velezensis]
MVRDVEMRIDIFNKVIELAEKKRKLIDKGQSYSNEDMELNNYLDRLTFEDIKVLQTVMYLGRDKDYDSKMSSAEIYREQRGFFDNEGWQRKEIEAGQMSEKTPLDRYIINGLDILNIDRTYKYAKGIEAYKSNLGIFEKSYVLLIVTPRDKFPESTDNKLVNEFLKGIFPNKDKYIGIYEESRDEILQDVYFRMRVFPLIQDKYNYANMRVIYRANKQEIESYFAVKEFYDQVSKCVSESRALYKGLDKATSFLDKYPLNDFDVKIVRSERYDDGCVFLDEMSFENSDGYHFEYFFCSN